LVEARGDPGATVEIEQAALIESWDPQRAQKTVSRRESSERSGQGGESTFVRVMLRG
jgi:hypothetical protein